MRAIFRFDNVDKYVEGEFSDREPVTIGREADNRVALPFNILSRHHAKIFCEDGVWYIEDLDSANGTFYRGQQLKPNVKTKLVNGDVVRFGSVAMTLSFVDSDGEKVVEKVVEKIIEKPVEKIVERVVEKEVIKEVIKEIPVAKAFIMPTEIKGKPVPPFAPEDPSKPFRPGLKMPVDLSVSPDKRTIRLPAS